MGFWKAPLMKDKALLQKARSEESMGHLGKITTIKDLPSEKKLTAYILEAMKLNELGKKLPSKPKTSEKKEIEVPDYFKNELQKNKKAGKIFEAFSNSNKKEYVEWIVDAKSETTRNNRMATAMEWIADGKIKNWKYLKAQ